MTELDVSNEQENDAELPRESASEMLTKAREGIGLSQKEVAEQLFLTGTFIRYIDAGEFEKFPKPAFIKGYLRSYARVVKLSGDEVVAAYEREQLVEPQMPQIGALTEEPVGSSNFTGPVLQTGVIGLVAVVAVSALVWWFTVDGTDRSPVVTEPIRPAVIEEIHNTAQEEASQAEPFEQTADSTLAQISPPEQTGLTPEQAASAPAQEAIEPAEEPRIGVDKDGQKLTKPLEITSDKDIQIDRVRDGDTNYITVYAGGEDAMEFSFTDECWVEIEDGDGEKVYGDLNRAGDIMTVYGVAPFVVLFGRAPAVSMTYEGRSVNLARFTTRENTARVRTARL